LPLLRQIFLSIIDITPRLAIDTPLTFSHFHYFIDYAFIDTYAIRPLRHWLISFDFHYATYYYAITPIAGYAFDAADILPLRLLTLSQAFADYWLSHAAAISPFSISRHYWLFSIIDLPISAPYAIRCQLRYAMPFRRHADAMLISFRCFIS